MDVRIFEPFCIAVELLHNRMSRCTTEIIQIKHRFPPCAVVYNVEFNTRYTEHCETSFVQSAVRPLLAAVAQKVKTAHLL